MSERSVEERLERLERTVEEIQALMARSGPTAQPAEAAHELPVVGAPAGRAAQPPAPRPAREPIPAAAAPPRPPMDWVALGYLWVARGGLVLLSLGLLFLFRYAVERGLITPPLRVAFGLLLGSTLLVLGTRLHAALARRAYALILLGGGLGILYLSAYAAFAFYQLVTAQLAIAALAAMTLLSIRLAVHRDQVVLAQLGAIGAFAAPMLIQTPHPSAVLLACYLVLVAAWTGWTAVREGWRSLGWLTVCSALAVLGAARLQGSLTGTTAQIALITAALLTGPAVVAALMAREELATAHPDAWRRRPGGWLYPTASTEALDVGSVATLAALVSVLFAGYVAIQAEWQVRAAGIIGLGEAALLGGLAWTWRARPPLSRAVALAAAVPLVLGTLGLDIPEYRGLLAAEGLAVVLVGGRTSDSNLTFVGHANVVLAGLAFFAFLTPHLGQRIAVPVLAADLVAVAVALYLYGVPGLVGLLAWLLLALQPLAAGAYLVTGSWGAVAAGLLLGGWARNDARLRAGGLLAAAAVALKLVLVDTAELPAAGRIVVFLAFGAVFLALGALYRRQRATG